MSRLRGKGYDPSFWIR